MKQEKNWTVPGFGPMTRVTTNFGQIPAQALRVRDLVRTQSGDFLPIVWLDRILLNEDFMVHHPEAMPIELQPSVFGPGKPAKSVVLSPGQDVCPEPGFGDPNLTRVSDMLQRPGAMRRPEQIYTYTVFHLGKPEMVDCEGLWIYLDPKAQDLGGGSSL
ncbi:Hint domain-containing protein [Actibacterium pelagium]|nr:Hint domain-containing protein [Actibacterium pelagium]